MSSDCCRVAIAALDRALDDRPDKIYHDLAEVIRCLVLLRTELAARRREGAAGARLHKARDELASLLDER